MTGFRTLFCTDRADLKDWCRGGIITLILLCAGVATAAVPQSINYQGFLTDSSGMPINSSVSVTFRVYSSPTGGSALWSETDMVTVVNGKFVTQLGDTISWPNGLFDNSTLFLGLEVNSDGEMEPRRPLTTTPFAFKADNSELLQGVGPSSFMGISGGTVTGTYNFNGDVNVAGKAFIGDLEVEGNTNVIDLIMGGGGALVFQDGSSQSTNAINAVLSADGTGSTLDADLLDGMDSNQFLKKSGDSMSGDLIMQTGKISSAGGLDLKSEGNVLNVVDLAFASGLGGGIQFEDGSFQGTNALNSLLAADGSGSGLDADLLDGKNLNEVIAAAGGGDAWRVVVAPRGGDFTTIMDAINSINPTTSNPFVVEVRPGVYNEHVQLKSYVHLKGAGKETTIIKPIGIGGDSDEESAVISMVNLTAVKVTGFTLAGGDFEGDESGAGAIGIYDIGSSPTIADTRFQYFMRQGGLLDSIGVYSSGSVPQIFRNEFIGIKNVAVYLESSDAIILESRFRQTGGTTFDCDVVADASDAVIVGNHFQMGKNGICGFGSAAGLPSLTVSGNQFFDKFTAVMLDKGEAQVTGNHIEATTGANHDHALLIEKDGSALLSSNTIVGYQSGVTNLGTASVTSNQIRGCIQVGQAIFNDGTANIMGNIIDSCSDGIRDTSGETQIVANRLTNISNRNISSAAGAMVLANVIDPNATNSSSENKVSSNEGFTFESTGGGIVISAGGSSISISQNGNISIDGSGEISVTSDGSMNFVSNKDINFDAAIDINIDAARDINFTPPL